MPKMVKWTNSLEVINKFTQEKIDKQNSPISIK